MSLFGDFCIMLAVGGGGGGGPTYEIKSVTAMSGTSNPSVGSVAVPIPGDAVVGDVLIIGVQAIGGSAGTTITEPSGPVEISEQNLNGTSDWTQAIYYHVVTGSEGASLTFTFNKSCRPHWFVVCASGVDTTTPVEGAATGTGSGTTMTGPATTTTHANEIVLHIYFDGITGAGSGANWLTPGGSWTQLLDRPKDNFGGQGEGNLGITYQVIASAGAVGSESASKSVSSGWRAFTICLVPA